MVIYLKLAFVLSILLAALFSQNSFAKAFSEEQLGALRKVFDNIDYNNDSKYDESELDNLCKQTLRKKKINHYTKFISSFDKNDDQILQYSELMENKDMKDLFEVFDTNSDLLVTQEEVVAYADAKIDELVINIIKEADINRNGFVNWKEYLEFLENNQMFAEDMMEWN